MRAHHHDGRLWTLVSVRAPGMSTASAELDFRIIATVTSTFLPKNEDRTVAIYQHHGNASALQGHDIFSVTPYRSKRIRGVDLPRACVRTVSPRRTTDRPCAILRSGRLRWHSNQDTNCPCWSMDGRNESFTVSRTTAARDFRMMCVVTVDNSW